MCNVNINISCYAHTTVTLQGLRYWRSQPSWLTLDKEFSQKVYFQKENKMGISDLLYRVGIWKIIKITFTDYNMFDCIRTLTHCISSADFRLYSASDASHVSGHQQSGSANGIQLPWYQFSQWNLSLCLSLTAPRSSIVVDHVHNPKP